MKKTLIALIVILIALILAMALFLVGMTITRNSSIEEKETNQTEIYQTDKQQEKNDDAVNPEDHKGDDKDEEDEKNVNIGIVLDDDENTYEETDSLYRVRKSKNDASSQLGAFQKLENAKALAQKHKDEGYEVYDESGCVYAP